MPKTRRTIAGKSTESSSQSSDPKRNKLLAGLPAGEFARLRPLLTYVPLKHRQVLHAAGERLRAVYFPVDGVCSMVTSMEDGRMVEVATVGNEGMTCVAAVFGGRSATGDVVIQIPGSAHMMLIDVFAAEMERRGALYEIVSRYAHVLIAFIMQSAACNGLHAADERCARWLLHSHDRLGKDSFGLTQELLAIMLGVRRATITVIASEFQRAGLVEFGQRRVTIRDRSGLEAMACECYRVIKAQFDQI